MLNIDLRERLTSDERDLIRRVIHAGRRVRVTKRPDADIVDAMCELDIIFRRTYVADVAIRAFSLFVGPPQPPATPNRTARRAARR
jgi:hypothetical protein